MAPKKKEPKIEEPPKAPTVRLSQSPVAALTPAVPNPLVYFDIKIGSELAGRMVIELFAHLTPKTAENFRCLCTGEKGIGKQGKPLWYRKTPFHRVIPGFFAQGGDITNQTGTGGESIYDGQPFEDENFVKGHETVGCVSMCNSGPNTNESMFFINLVPNKFLNGKHVVFGQVQEDSMEVVRAIEAVGSWTGRLHKPVVIRRCGWLNKPTKEELAKQAEEEAAKKAEEEAKLLADEEAAKKAAAEAPAKPDSKAKKK